MVTRRGRRACARRQCRAQGCRSRPSARPARLRRSRSSRVRARAAGVAGAGGRGGAARASSPAIDRHAVHERCRRRRSPAAPCCRDPLRLYRRGRVRDFAGRRAMRSRWPSACWPSRRSRRSGSARATRCGSKPGSASTATTSTRRTTPVEAGARLDHRQAPPRRGRLPRRRAHPARSWPTAPARRRVGIRPDGRAPAREGTAIADAGRHPDRHGHQRRLRPVARRARSRWAMSTRAMPPPAPRSRWSCATCRAPARVAPMPFVPTRYYRG